MLEIIKNNNFCITGTCNFNNIYLFIQKNGGKIYNGDQLRSKYLCSQIDYVLYANNNKFNSKKCELIKSVNKHVKYININCFIKQCFIDIYNETFYDNLIKLLDKMKTLYKLKYGISFNYKIGVKKFFYIDLSTSYEPIFLSKNITLQKITDILLYELKIRS